MTDTKVTTFRDVDIFLSGTRFTAKLNGKNIYGPSVDAIIKKIKAAATFEPFDGLTEDNGGYKIVKVRVIGIEKDRTSSRFIIEGETNPYKRYYSIYPMEARPFLEQLQTAKKRLDDARNAYEKESGRLYEKLNKLARQPE